jgi:hypothetical protein
MSEEQLPAESETPAPAGPMTVVVIGDESLPLTQATVSAFNVPIGAEVSVMPLSEIDAVVEAQPGLVFFTDEIRIKKNDTFDDNDLLGALQKLLKMTDTGICIRSTLNIETTERIIMAMSKPAFDAKVVLMPDTTGSNDIATLINPPVQYLGGTQEAIQALMGILTNLSHFSAADVKTGSAFDVVYANLAISGFRVVKQKYFDELYNGVMDLKNSNPMIVRRLVEFHPALVDPSLTVPSFVTNKSVHDATVFNGATDSLTVLSAALGE